MSSEHQNLSDDEAIVSAQGNQNRVSNVRKNSGEISLANDVSESDEEQKINQADTHLI